MKIIKLIIKDVEIEYSSILFKISFFLGISLKIFSKDCKVLTIEKEVQKIGKFEWSKIWKFETSSVKNFGSSKATKFEDLKHRKLRSVKHR